jgi:hypothetical protein
MDDQNYELGVALQMLSNSSRVNNAAGSRTQNKKS